MLVCLLIYWV